MSGRVVLFKLDNAPVYIYQLHKSLDVNTKQANFALNCNNISLIDRYNF